MPSSVKELKEHLARTKAVKVPGMGSEWEFLIKKVPALTWDEKNEWYSDLIAQDPKAWQEKLSRDIASPSAEVMQTVILRGVSLPPVSREERTDTVSVEDIMRDDILARNLYAEIAAYAFEGFFKVRNNARNQHTD